MPTMPTILESLLFQILLLVMVMGRDHASHHAHHAQGISLRSKLLRLGALLDAFCEKLWLP
jgi:hypothetical protein